MTRKEAEKEAAELNKTEPKWKCPADKKMCDKECLCFVPALVDRIEDETEKTKGNLHDITDDNFEVVGFVCDNAMYLGNPFICSG